MERQFIIDYLKGSHFIYIGLPVFILIYAMVWVNLIRYIQGKTVLHYPIFWGKDKFDRVLFFIGVVPFMLAGALYYMWLPGLIIAIGFCFVWYLVLPILRSIERKRSANLKKRGNTKSDDLTWPISFYDDDEE